MVGKYKIEVDLTPVPDHELVAMINYHTQHIKLAELNHQNCDHNKEWLPVYQAELDRRKEKNAT